MVGALEGKGDIEKDFSIVFTLIDRVEGVSYSSLACRWILSTGKKYPSIFPILVWFTRALALISRNQSDRYKFGNVIVNLALCRAS